MERRKFLTGLSIAGIASVAGFSNISNNEKKSVLATDASVNIEDSDLPIQVPDDETVAIPINNFQVYNEGEEDIDAENLEIDVIIIPDAEEDFITDTEGNAIDVDKHTSSTEFPADIEGLELSVDQEDYDGSEKEAEIRVRAKIESVDEVIISSNSFVIGDESEVGNGGGGETSGDGVEEIVFTGDGDEIAIGEEILFTPDGETLDNTESLAFA